MPYIKPLDQVSFADTQTLMQSATLEWTTLEVKRDFDLNDVVEVGVQFSNTFGGILLIGVEELKNVSPPGNFLFVGVPYQARDQDSILNKLHSSIHPGVLPDIKPLILPSDSSRCVWFVRFRESENKPHWILSDNRVLVRYGSQKRNMDPRLIQQAFLDRGRGISPGPGRIDPFVNISGVPPYKGPKHSLVSLAAMPASSFVAPRLTKERDDMISEGLHQLSEGAHTRRWDGITFEGTLGADLIYFDFGVEGRFVAIQHEPQSFGETFEVVHLMMFIRRALRSLSRCSRAVGYFGSLHMRLDIVPPEMIATSRTPTSRSLRILSSSDGPQHPYSIVRESILRDSKPIHAAHHTTHLQTVTFAEVDDYADIALDLLNRLLRTFQVNLNEDILRAFVNLFRNSQ